MNFTRREMTKMILGAGALALIDIDLYGQALGDSKRSMRYLATRTASGEGVWTNLKVEGKIPKNLNGNLFRTAPGESERFGITLKHLFDGDAYFAGWRFREGKVSLQGRYIPTKQRLREREAGKMIYNEYGTLAPDPLVGGKNQPSVNVIEWRGKLLGLSEGGLPTIVNPDTFDLEGYENFGGVVPDYLTFTAHPRFDPKTGDMFAWGFEKRPPGTMHIVQVNHKTGKAETLYKMPMRGFYMVHDAMLTENYFVILILPTFYDMQKASGGAAMGDALIFDEKQPAKLYAFPRDNGGGKASPVEIELPPYAIFHYGNAFEKSENEIVFEAITSETSQFIEVLRNWRTDKMPELKPNNLRQISVDLAKRKISGSNVLAQNVEFPRYDSRLTGKKSRYLYVAENLYGENAAIVRVDLEKGNFRKISTGKTRTVAEPVFVPKTEKTDEDRGWILAQGFDADKNENFIEIRDAQTLEFQARVWAGGQHFPLGFHGNFYPSAR